MLFPTSNVPSHRRSLVQCNWCLSLHMISSTNLLSSISKIYDIRIEDFRLAWNSGKQLKASSIHFRFAQSSLWFRLRSGQERIDFAVLAEETPCLGCTAQAPTCHLIWASLHDQGWVWGKFRDWCFFLGITFKHGKDVFLLVGWLVVESFATAGLNTILGTLRPRNSTRSCGLVFCVSLVFCRC